MNKSIAILVNFNNAPDTIEAVKSLLKQSVPISKILVVDNHSTDSSVEILRKEFSQDEVEILQTKENNGFAGGNNFAIKYALENLDFEYFLIINNDTNSDECVNKNFIEYYEKNSTKQIGILTGKILNYYQPEKLLFAGGTFNRAKCSGYHIGDGEADTGQFNEITECNFATACLWFFSKSLISKIGYLPEEYFLYLEDVDYCLQVRKAGLKIIYLPQVKILHKEGATTKDTKKTPNFFYTNRNRLIFAEKNLSGAERFKFYLFFFPSRIIRFFQYLFRGKLINTLRGIREGLQFKAKNNGKSKRNERNPIFKLLIYTINITLYIISKCVRKNKNIWVFGAWFGQHYSDNSKYLFEYANKYHKKIRAIWLSENKNVCHLVKLKGYEVYHTYSIKGYYYSMKANVSISCTGLNDINVYIPANILVNLWHGIALKKICYSDDITFKYSKTKQIILNFIFPCRRKLEDYSLTCACSAKEANNLSEAFRQPIRKIITSGLPRNDVFEITKSNNISKIIYMPTHRNEGEFDLYKLFFNDIEFINKKLKEIDVTLYIKFHYYHLKNSNMQDRSNIFFIKDEDIKQDIYSFLPQTDILITDYSSVYFDYLLIDNPIIFAPFDYEEYIKKDRELYYDYDKVTPGPKCKNWTEVLEWIIKFKNDPNLYKEERKKIRDYFHQYQDNKSSERVMKNILDLNYYYPQW